MYMCGCLITGVTFEQKQLRALLGQRLCQQTLQSHFPFQRSCLQTLVSLYLNMETFHVPFVLLMTLAAAGAQSFHFGACPQPSVQDNFNVTKYMGTWYEIEKLPAMFERGKCVQATYSLLGDGTVSVHNAELLSNGKINSIDGVARVKDPSQPAILGVSFFKGVPDAPYLVLSTDYQSYALVYSCNGYFGVFHIDFAWILARTRVLTEEIINQSRDKLAAAGVDIDRLTRSNQTGCDIMT
ncbi:apolipoprotein D-like isoform X1 [Solea solea]|uniref:apolipoprotein D-like isoform X1 n=2 Tax=Solea solea TaxID=90069 RepID=UPI00272CCDCD|nr:apolipoprotein D-like isoform X1 [Solea solea]